MRNPYLSMLKIAWKYARHEKKQFLLIYFFFVMTNIVIACNPLFYGWFVNELQMKGVNVLKTGWIYIALFLGFRLLEWAFHGPGRVWERRLAFSLSRNFMDKMYHKVLHRPMSWHQENHSGTTLSKLRKAHDALRDFFQNGFLYFYSFGKFIFSFGAMLFFSPLFGSISVILGVFTILIIRKFDKPFVTTLKEVNEKEHAVNSNLADSLSNIATVITLRLEKRMHSAFMSKLLAVYPAFKKNVTINEWKWFTAQMMVGIIYGLTTVGYLYQHWTPGEPFLIGGLIILLGYVNQFTSVFNDIASHYSQIVKFDTDMQNIDGIEAAVECEHHATDVQPLPSQWKTLDIDHLTFLRGRSRSLPRPTGMDDVSIRIERGRRIALIGESGSGKSTLLTLLRGLHPPTEKPSVFVDEQTFCDFESISTTVTLLPQEPEIFENTVLYNITLGLPFSDAEIRTACEATQFSSVLDGMPAGLNTEIVEKGVNLSGGQKQRLALARGVLAARNSEIILLDEPTSSIDPKTEQMVYRNLFECFHGKTVVSSLHRLHLLPLFDYVYILKDGAIVDKGTPDELERYSLIFKEIREHQIHAMRHSENMVIERKRA